MRPPRAIAGFVVFLLWLGFLAAYESGDTYCYDPATGRSGIDALDHCASHQPLGLDIAISETWPLVSFVIAPAVLVALWWPYRPWRRRA